MKAFISFANCLAILLSIANSSFIINAQQEKTTLYYNKAIILDTLFFQQLDSILDVNKMEKHKYYYIDFSSKYKDIANKMEFTLHGFETLIYEKGYIADYNRRKYYIDTKSDNNLVKKGRRFSITYNLPIRPHINDFNSTYMVFIYENKKLQLTADSRVDLYLVE